MGLEAVKRHLVNNKNAFWFLLSRNKEYAICSISDNALFNGCIIKDNGKNNRITIADGAKVSNCTFCFNGNDSHICIDKNAVINGCVFFADDDRNTIRIGENSTFTGKTELITVEGTSITIGNDCMFAYGIVVRTGDHHSIVNTQGIRINTSKNIEIGDHVWIGQNAFILKGVKIVDECIVGACSVVTKNILSPGSVVAGNPAKTIRTDIRWDRERL